MKIRIQIAGIILQCAVLLTACSFHLRGIHSAYPPSFGPIAIQVLHADHTWEALLRQQLVQVNLNVVQDATQATYLLVIMDEQSNNTIVSISSSSSPRQYELVYKVTFSLQKKSNDGFIAPTTLRLTRPITINNNLILGSHDEEDQLLRDLRREAALQILDQMYRRAWSTLKSNNAQIKA